MSRRRSGVPDPVSADHPGLRRNQGWLIRLLLAVLLLQTSVQLARPVTSYRALALGGGAAHIGYITAAFAILPLLTAVPLGRLLDRWRPGPFLGLAVLLLAAASGLLAIADSIVDLAVGNAVLGLGNLCLMVPAQALIARRSPNATHDRDYGFFAAAVAGGQLLGPGIAGLVLTSGGALDRATRSAFLACVVIAALAVVVTYRLDDRSIGPRSSSALPAARTPTLTLLKLHGMPAGILASLTLIAAADVLIGYLPLIGEERGISPGVIGLLLSIRAGTSMVSRLLIDKLVTRWSRAGLIAVSAAGSGLTLVLVTLPVDVVVLGLILAVVGLLIGLGQPLTMSLVVSAVPADARATALALRFTGNRAGQVVLPLAAGAAAAGAGTAAAFWLLGALLGLSAVLVRR